MANDFPKMTAADSADFMGVTIQSLHRYIKSGGLDSQKSNNRVYFGFETARDLFRLRFDKRIISFQVVKGGTGKTSIALSFATRANLYGARVLCIDLDQQGNLTQALGIDATDKPILIDVLDNGEISKAIINVSPGFDLIPSRIENAVLDKHLMIKGYPLDKVYVDLISKVKHEYDLIVIDCPPALGHSVAAATLASDTVIAPIVPDSFSLSGLKITHDEIISLGDKFHKTIRIKILINKFDQRNALSGEVLTNIITEEKYKGKVCSTFIRACQEIQNAIYTRTSIYNSLRNNTAKEDIDLFTKEILALNEKIAEAKESGRKVA